MAMSVQVLTETLFDSGVAPRCAADLRWSGCFLGLAAQGRIVDAASIGQCLALPFLRGLDSSHGPNSLPANSPVARPPMYNCIF